jgi:drug/metabolite transporter (DMT)-like permease
MSSPIAKPRPWLLFAAFAAVYLLWGSTYLAIKYAIATMPSLLMAGSRFVLAGTIMTLVGRFSADYEKPTARHWRTSFVVGGLLLVGGNGGVVLAERYVPSSLAALLVATEPFWIVILGWLWLRGARPGWQVVLGLLLGFAGVYLLVGEQLFAGAGASHAVLGGVGLVLLAAFSWAAGSIYGLRAGVPRSPVLASGMQMLAGGALLLLLGTATGEWGTVRPGGFGLAAWLGTDARPAGAGRHLRLRQPRGGGAAGLGRAGRKANRRNVGGRGRYRRLGGAHHEPAKAGIAGASAGWPYTCAVANCVFKQGLWDSGRT